MQGMIAAAARKAASGLFHRLPTPAKTYCADVVGRSFEEITYHRLIGRGFRPAGIIDVGAFEGNWTRLARRLFGPVPVLMVEAQPAKRPLLDAVVAELPDVHLALSPLSARSGEEITFYEMGTGSSFLPEQSNAARQERRLVTRTLDEVAAEALPGLAPLFLKIDVQGAEQHVLAGGPATLARCEAVQLEVALLQYNQGAPLMPEIIATMQGYGFLPIEVSGFSRPGGHLVQIDLLFARENSALRPGYFTF